MARLRPPRLRFLGRVAGLAVYLVSGEQVRNKADVDFTMGGNEAIYPAYVPRGEIWIDDAMDTLDRMATALHEIVERDLMLNHGQDYDRAHDTASAREIAFRRELVRKRPSGFEANRVSAAFRTYLSEKSERKTARQIERELATEFGRRSVSKR